MSLSFCFRKVCWCSWVAVIFVSACAPKGEQDEAIAERYSFTDAEGGKHEGVYVAPNLPDVVVGKSGHLVIFYPNGQKWIEGDFMNGFKNGVFRMWRPDGSLFTEESYDSDVLDGKLVWWYANGNKQMEVDWIDGEKNGLWLEWNEVGALTKSNMFINNKQQQIDPDKPVSKDEKDGEGK